MSALMGRGEYLLLGKEVEDREKEEEEWIKMIY